MANHPPPPPFWKSFTEQNISHLRKLRKEATKNSTPEPNILNLPPELRYLIPPQPPANGQWTSYAEPLTTSSTDPSLSEAGIEQLYPPTADAKLNPQAHLIALARSLLTTYLGLVGVLSRNPELFVDKTEDLQTIAYNIEDLVNQYRPHQAREELISMMEDRIKRLREEVRAIREGRERVEGLMVGLAAGHGDGKEERMVEDEVAKRRTDAEEDGGRAGRQKGAWEAIEAEFQDHEDVR